MTLHELAERLGCRLEGDGAIEVTRVAGLEDAGPGDLTFLSNPKYASTLGATRASAAIVDEQAAGAPCAVLRTPHVYLAFAEAVALLTPPARPAPGISALASVHPTARVGVGVSIGAFVTIGAGTTVGARTALHPHVYVGPGVDIGEDCDIHAHVSLREHIAVGHRVVVQNGAVIGSDGFGYTVNEKGERKKIPQIGIVEIGDDVEIGANVTVDRGALGPTVIGRGTKIDNLVQIAHNVNVGEHCLIVSQTGVAGSTRLGHYVILGGQVGIAGHLKLGNKVSVAAQSGVMHSIKDGEKWFGTPAQPDRQTKRQFIAVQQLPELLRRVAELERRLGIPGDAPARMGGT